MPASKWIELKRFNQNKDEVDATLHANRITFFNKPNKPERWYFKQYISASINKYAKEASAGDLYRFVLGKSRAAKSLVVHQDETPIGVISQHNPAGFTTINNLKIIHAPDRAKAKLTYKKGLGEVRIAECILQDTDGTTNKDNCGYNNSNEISRIDYDRTFRKSIFSFDLNEISDFFQVIESEVSKTKSEKILYRFYASCLKIALLNPEILNIIFNRHMTETQNHDNLLNMITPRINVLQKTLLKSEKFKEFLNNFEFKELEQEFEIFFKHEHKYNPSQFNDCITSLRELFDQLKLNCSSNPRLKSNCCII